MSFHSAVQQQLPVNFLFFPEDSRKVSLKPNCLFSAKYKERKKLCGQKKASLIFKSFCI